MLAGGTSADVGNGQGWASSNVRAGEHKDGKKRGQIAFTIQAESISKYNKVGENVMRVDIRRRVADWIGRRG